MKTDDALYSRVGTDMTAARFVSMAHLPLRTTPVCVTRATQALAVRTNARAKESVSTERATATRQSEVSESFCQISLLQVNRLHWGTLRTQKLRSSCVEDLQLTKFSL